MLTYPKTLHFPANSKISVKLSVPHSFEKYRAKYASTSAQNKKVRSIVHEKIEQIVALESTVGAEPHNGIMGDWDKSASKVPPYNGTEGGSSAELWLDNLEKLQGVHKWSDDQTLRAGQLWLYQASPVPGGSTRKKMTSPQTQTLLSSRLFPGQNFCSDLQGGEHQPYGGFEAGPKFSLVGCFMINIRVLG